MKLIPKRISIGTKIRGGKCLTPFFNFGIKYLLKHYCINNKIKIYSMRLYVHVQPRFVVGVKKTSCNRSVTVRRLSAARLHKTVFGLSPSARFCSATFFCARKNAAHFSLSGTKKRQLQPERYVKVFAQIILL
jgi:hypothetical protein